MKQQIISHLPGDHPWQNAIHWFDSIDSTNTYAKTLSAQGAPEGTIVIADHQTGGRGRMGRSFSSPAGLGIYLSVILRPQCPPKELMHLTCAAGVAAAEAVEAVCDARPGIKWTNDLVLGKRKLGGILTELSIDSKTGLVDYAIIGIGINCCQKEDDFPPEIRDIAISLGLTSQHRPRLVAALIEALHKMSSRLFTQKAAIMDAFRSRCVTIGQEISILRGDEVRHAKAADVDAEGGLVVQFPDGRVETVTSGEVSIRGMYGYL